MNNKSRTHTHPYPHIHPFARQSQTDCLTPSAEESGLLETGQQEAKEHYHQSTKAGGTEHTSQPELEIWETILEEGEVLFIPAYWWHRLTALDNAISLNAW